MAFGVVGMAPSTKSANTRAQVAGSNHGSSGGGFRWDAGFGPQGGGFPRTEWGTGQLEAGVMPISLGEA